jgi:TolB-like protein
MRTSVVAFTACLAASVPALGQDAPAEPAEEGCSVAVLDLQGKGLDDSQMHVAQILTDSIATELSASTECRIITQADIASMLDFEATKMATCSDAAESCIAEIGGALGVQRVVAGSVGKIGTTYTIQLRLIDIHEANVDKRADLTSREDAAELRDTARNGARQLFGLDAAPTTSGAATEEATAGGGPFASPWIYVGSGVAALGLVGAGVGGFLAWDANEQLGDPAKTGKGGIQTIGVAGLGIAAGGAVLTLVGVGLVPLAFME